VGAIDSSAHYGPWQPNLADQYSTPQPSTGVLVAVSLWALALAVVGAVTGAAALITVAGDPPTWYPPSILATGAASLTVTIAGCGWSKWRGCAGSCSRSAQPPSSSPRS
jgi:hypothetical protein